MPQENLSVINMSNEIEKEEIIIGQAKYCKCLARSKRNNYKKTCWLYFSGTEVCSLLDGAFHK